jgi:hypothetical protein
VNFAVQPFANPRTGTKKIQPRVVEGLQVGANPDHRIEALA